MNSEKTVLFDLDGTLLNTLGDLTASTNAAMEKMGFATHTLDDVRRFVGNGIGLLIARSIPEAKKTPSMKKPCRYSGNTTGHIAWIPPSRTPA